MRIGRKFANGAVTAAMGFAFNQLTQLNRHEHGSKAWAMREAELSGGRMAAVEIPRGSGRWNVLSVDDAARYAARLPTDSNISGQTGGSFHGFGGVIGMSSAWRTGLDSAGNACSTVEVCLQFGFGLSFGIGPSTTISASEFTVGRDENFGAFGNFGKGILGGASLDVTSPAGTADLRTQLGAGASGGIQWCMTETEC